MSNLDLFDGVILPPVVALSNGPTPGAKPARRPQKCRKLEHLEADFFTRPIAADLKDAEPSHQGLEPSREDPAGTTEADPAAVLDAPIETSLANRARGADIVVCSIPPVTFQQAVEAIAASGTVSRRQVRSYRQSLDWFEKRRPRKRNGQPQDALPCDPVLLRPILDGVSPGKNKIGKKRWSNLRADLAAMQRKTGWLPPKSSGPFIRSNSWKNLIQMIAHASTRGMFVGFAAFCETKNIEPQDVFLGLLDEYRLELEANRSRLHPEDTIQAMRYAWNRLLRDHPDCGVQPMPYKRHPQQICFDSADTAKEFYADLNAYITKLGKPGRFTEGFPAVTPKSTIDTRRQTLTLSRSILIRRGWKPEKLTSLATILTPAAIEIILDDYAERNCPDGRWTTGARSTAAILTTVARQWGKPTPEDFERIKQICRSVKPPKNNYPKKARERLAQFDDKKIERRFFELPDLLWKQARELEKRGLKVRAAQNAKYALALAIAFDKPLRRQNLAHLDLELDFARDQHGRIIGIRIEGDRTTKGAAIMEAALSSKTQQWLITFLDRFRPHLLTIQSTALFPGQKHEYVDKGGFGEKLTAIISEKIGIDVNPHLIRAFIGTVILDEDPRAVVLAQRMLDHQTPITTTKYYAMQRGRAVGKEYADIMQRRMRRLGK